MLLKKLLRFIIVVLLFFSVSGISGEKKTTSTNPPIYIAFLWHMHQPIYWPYETVVQTDQNSRYSYSVTDIHNQRIGPYTTWPKNAVQQGISAGLQHLGAQVSFSGSLIENLNNLESSGNGNFSNWKSSWNYIKNQTTSLGNPRLDMVGFGYFHPLMGLIDYADIRKQIQKHKQILSDNFPGAYSKGMFPPENAFSPRMIPALTAEGIQWVLVDNIHFDRACNNYPFNTGGNIYEANKADVINPDPNDWIQLNGLWAPTRNSARWGRQPHYVEYVDPATGQSTKIIAIPADRYMGNEDGRGGFGALNYEGVMSQLESYNTDSNHPILIVLHHDGDNYGGGSDGYYNSNFAGFVNWLQANPSRFVGTTIQDYLQMFPPDTNDVIHIEDGSWSGADNGDPEFKKWLGDPDGSGYSPDRNSWGVVTAAKNFVLTAEQINSGSSNTQNAWKYMLNAEASDYWYWDGSQNGVWDSHPTRASNQAVSYAQPVVGAGTDLTGPTIFAPQREPYNPGGTEWGINQTNTMTVWSYVFDVHGLKYVKLKYRTDADGVNSPASTDNETYSGGSEVSGWTELSMTGTAKSSTTNPAPSYKAKEFTAQVSGMNNVLLDYYIEAEDSLNNISKSPIQHVWIGQNSGGGGGGGGGTTGVSWSPVNPTKNDTITIVIDGATQGAKLHWGVNNNGSTWLQPNNVYWPSGSSLFGGTGPAVQSPMSGPNGEQQLIIKVGPFNNPAQNVSKLAFVIHYNNDTWDNNNNQDYHITFPDSSGQQSFVMDGVVDASANIVATNSGLNLYIGWSSPNLYVATQSAQQTGGDMFIFVSDSPRTAINAPWAKAGNVSAWSAFLANESSNNYNAWNDATGTTLKSAGTYLEGTINIQEEFGHIPAKLYLAVGKYATNDGGSLQVQIPAGNGNGDIEPAELYEFDYTFPGILPPAAPALSSPANGATNQQLTLSLQWQASSGATTYHAQLGTDTGFTSVLVNDSLLSGFSKNLSSLSPGTQYVWRVRAKNAGGWGNWSGSRTFTTGTPVFSLTDTALQFDSVTVGLSKQDSITVTNTGVATLSISSVISNSGVFSVTPSNGSISPSSNKKFFITFTPAEQGETTGAVTFTHNGTGSSFTLNVSGVGVPPGVPAFSANKTSIDFDSVFVNLTATDTLTVSNPGTALLVVSSISSSNGVFTVSPQTGNIAPSATGQFIIRFMPVEAGETSGTISFHHNADSIDFILDVHGIGKESPYVQRTVDVAKGWNMMSLPLAVDNDSTTIVFPGATLPVYSFTHEGGYIAHSTLQFGEGYWMKFPSTATIMVTGLPVSEFTIPIVADWNFIGMISDTVNVADIIQDPPGCIASQFFSFEGSYIPQTTLYPGKAYWVKGGYSGTLTFAPAMVTKSLKRETAGKPTK